MAEAVSRLPRPAREFLRLALVAVAYYVAARLSLGLALVHGQVTPVWPPTGIALVAFLVFGLRAWPAIAAAAFAVNLPLGPSPLGAGLIAAGNTLAPLVSAVLLKHVGFRLELDRLRDAAWIMLLGALAGMAISASVGTLVLVLSGSVPVANFASTWAVWWTGDAMGILLVAPFLLSLRPRPGVPGLDWRRRIELTALLGAVGIATFIVFQNQFRLEYLVFPLIMLAAFRFRLRGAAPAALIASGVAVLAAVNGTGPFATETLLQKMVTLQVFNVFVALASFVLASYVDTRESEERVSRLYLASQLSNTAKNEFLKMASHELRAPLTVIAGYLSMISDGALGAPPPRWSGPLEILSSKTWELNKIMDDLLAVSRFEGDVMTGSRKPVDLRTVVREAVDRAEPRASLGSGAITVESGGESITVMGDAAQLARIMDNLIINGLNYTERPSQIGIAVSTEGGRAVVRVSDNGVGIAGGNADLIFEPFRRGLDPLVAQVPGTGLGLYISRQLAVAHGGTLLLERSEVGKGSTFTLSIPIATTESDGGAQSVMVQAPGT
ncbi:MAG TPA: MASE1 domain-containing protein [Candidatus Nitrosotalea sp.]|nr:MASE1 domain-containing protein [Candidatus Nitrosotalea sp.]